MKYGVLVLKLIITIRISFVGMCMFVIMSAILVSLVQFVSTGD